MALARGYYWNMVLGPKIPDSPKCVLENKHLVLGVTLGELSSSIKVLSSLSTAHPKRQRQSFSNI